MTSTPTLAAAKGLDALALKTLADRTGPCITIVIPDHHPGVQEGSRGTVFTDLLRAAREQISHSRLGLQEKNLILALERVSQDVSLQKGGPGCAIFRTVDFLACYRAHVRSEKLSIASHFLLSPFITAALLPVELLVLGLSTKHLRLLEYSHGECREIELPQAVPDSLEAAGQFNRSERNLENRSSAGVPVGDLHGVRFGTATDRDTQGAYLHDFFEIVDRGMKPFQQGRPLLLMGVSEEVAAYRLAKNDNALLSIDSGNIEFLSPAEIACRVQEALLAESYSRGAEALTELCEMRDRDRVITDIQNALRAASQGRVHRLCIRAETELMGPMEPDLDRAGVGEEDLLNATVVETLRRGGQVFVVT